VRPRQRPTTGDDVATLVTIDVQIHSPSASVVTLRGEHDLDSRPGVMLALAAASDRRNVLVDFTECAFIDSSIIGALLLAAKQLQVRGGTLELVIPPDARAVRRVLEITGVQDVLPSHATRAAGIASVHVERTRGTPREQHDDPASAGRPRDLRAVSDLIDQLQAKAESTRARRAADRVTVVRACVAPDLKAFDVAAEDSAGKRAA
jgi:anti-anti-sigma factor